MVTAEYGTISLMAAFAVCVYGIVVPHRLPDSPKLKKFCVMSLPETVEKTTEKAFVLIMTGKMFKVSVNQKHTI